MRPITRFELISYDLFVLHFMLNVWCTLLRFVLQLELISSTNGPSYSFGQSSTNSLDYILVS